VVAGGGGGAIVEGGGPQYAGVVKTVTVTSDAQFATAIRVRIESLKQ
jgi:hypothetical protein